MSDNLQDSSDQQKGEAASVPRERIHPDVYTKLKQSDDGRVYVSIMLKPQGYASAKADRNKSFIKDAQDTVLASLASGEFELGYQYETVPMLAGHVKAEGLAKLAADPNVVSVKPSKIGATAPANSDGRHETDERIRNEDLLLATDRHSQHTQLQHSCPTYTRIHPGGQRC